MIIFGSSVAEVGFNTPVLDQELSLSTFNGALDGTRFQQYKCLVKEINTYSENIKYVVFGVTYFDFMKTTQLTEPIRFYPHLRNENVFKALYEIDSNLTLKMKYVPFYGYTQYTHVYYQNAAKGFLNYLTQNAGITIDSLKGFVPHDTKWNVDTTKAIDFAEITHSHELLEDFRLIKEELNKNGRKVIVVFMPMHISGQRRFTNLDDIIQKASSLADSGLFFDYSKSTICDSTEFFYNQNHLNKRGATIFTKRFAKEIKSKIEI